jgi:putative phosphoesterase
VRIAVLADTHIRDTGSRRLSDETWAHLREADVILHAGDVVEAGLLAALGQVAPVHAVLGNNDGALVDRLPETLELRFEGVRIAMLHDSGPRSGREGRLHRRFPEADLVVFGHSHIPWDAEGIGGQRLFNPGSPTEGRSQPHRTMGLIDVVDGRLRTRLVEVD